MQKLDRVIVPLRILLVLLFAGLVLAQVFSLPGTFAYRAAQSPESGFLPWGLLAFAILEVLCLQIVIVCIWRLLTLVKSDRIFSEKAFVWVDTIVWALAAGWLLLCAVFAALIGYIYFTPELRDPGTPILMIGIALVVGVLVLTVVVMRSLLRQATVLQSDLEQVI
jgi:uncharacterized membrane protein